MRVLNLYDPGAEVDVVSDFILTIISRDGDFLVLGEYPAMPRLDKPIETLLCVAPIPKKVLGVD
jgi:hypothetical protein